MMIIMLLVLWTWGLTPLWVNIVATFLCGINLIMKLFGYSLGKKVGTILGKLMMEDAYDQE